jgi:hypothetical protein
MSTPIVARFSLCVSRSRFPCNLGAKEVKGKRANDAKQLEGIDGKYAAQVRPNDRVIEAPT